MKYKKFKLIFIFLTLVAILIFSDFIVKKVLYPYKYRAYIEKYSKEFNLDPLIVLALIKTESNFRATAESSKNAIGLMQITEDTGRWAAGEMGIKDFKREQLKDPEYNIRMGCWYLDNLKTEFNGDMDLVLAAYNGGRTNVKRWLNDKEHSKDGKKLDYIPFKETDKYLKKVKVSYNIYKFLYK